MPMVGVITNVSISGSARAELARGLGEAVQLIPGKSESWLMLTFEPETRMAFRGKADEPVAFIAVDLYGGAPDAACDKLTARLCALAGEVLGIAADHVYVRYLATDQWGWNGANF